jgi:hypothetical protein
LVGGGVAGLCHHLLFIKTMDDKLTEKIQAYLNQSPGERNIVDGATMLLSLNRNQLFFQKVIRKPDSFADKVAYELRKHLQIRLDRQTVKDVVRMNQTVLPAAQLVLDEGAPIISTDEDTPQEAKIAKGKRADHDTLPEEIRLLWEENAELWYRIKELFEQLKAMEHATACDRYEYLKQLDESEKRYRANMQAYDSFVPGTASGEDEKQDKVEDDPATIAKKVGAARKYLSDNKKKLADFKDSDAKKYLALLAKVQERYDYLISTGNAIEAEQVNELAALGLKVK